MFNLREAFTYLFKEKNWPLKFLLPFVLQLIIVVPSILMSMQDSNVYDLNRRNFGSDYYYSNPSFNEFSIIYLIIFVISFFPYLIVILWYMYENTQAGIFNRETKAIWSNNFSDTLKKAGKYFLVSLVYGLIIAIPVVIIACLFAVIFTMIFAGAVGGFASSDSIMQGTAFLGGGILIGLFILICCISIILIIVYAFAYLVMTPSLLRMVATNTLGEGLKFSENWRIGRKYARRFFALLGLALVYGIVFGLFSGVLSAISSSLYTSNKVLGLGLEFINQAIFAAVTVYFTYFVYTRLLGQLFRKIISEDERLSYINLNSATEKHESSNTEMKEEETLPDSADEATVAEDESPEEKSGESERQDI